MRLTEQSILILDALVSQPDRTGAELIAGIEVSGGIVYPILQRMVREKLVIVRKEIGSPRVLGRPLRKFYTLTRKGQAVHGKFMAKLEKNRKGQLELVRAKVSAREGATSDTNETKR